MHRDIQGRLIKSPYALGPEGKKANKWLCIARGSSERLISMNIVSNSACEERAWRHWKEQCEKDGVPLPTFLDIDMILEQLKSAEACASLESYTLLSICWTSMNRACQRQLYQPQTMPYTCLPFSQAVAWKLRAQVRRSVRFLFIPTHHR